MPRRATWCGVLAALVFLAVLSLLVERREVRAGTSTGGTPTSMVVPAGTILPYGGTSAPTGYLFCDGTSYLRSTYPDLYTAIGNAFGTADGTHFNVPDLRGRFLRGQDEATARDPNAATRTAMNAGGGTGDNVGSVQTGATAAPGTEFTSANDSGHTHALSGNTGNGGTGATGDANQGFDQWGASTGAATSWAPFGGTPTQHQHAGPSHAHAQSGNTGTVSAVHSHSVSTGGDSETRPINACVRFIIKT